MTAKTPRHRLMQKADRYWSDPSVRLAKTNYKRRRRGQPERASLDEIPTSGEVASALPRDAAGKFVRI
jgi:hypothetical protein